MEAGAADAWLTPILMKKGRPAHTLSVLVDTANAEAVRAVILGRDLRDRPARVVRWASTRPTASSPPSRWTAADPGQDRAVRRQVVNVQPEYDDVAAAAPA